MAGDSYNGGVMIQAITTPTKGKTP